jgi:hypothetical protein
LLSRSLLADVYRGPRPFPPSHLPRSSLFSFFEEELQALRRSGKQEAISASLADRQFPRLRERLLRLEAGQSESSWNPFGNLTAITRTARLYPSERDESHARKYT